MLEIKNINIKYDMANIHTGQIYANQQYMRPFEDIYLQEVVRGVVYQHDESSCADVVNTPWEADEEDGRYMVNNLLLEVLKRLTHSEMQLWWKKLGIHFYLWTWVGLCANLA